MVVHTFWPFTTHSSPSRTARVDSEARSEPEPGSAEELAPDLLGGEDLAQVALLLGLGAVFDDAWARPGPLRAG